MPDLKILPVSTNEFILIFSLNIWSW